MKNKFIIIFVTLFILLASATIFIAVNLLRGKVFPNFFISGISISSMTNEEAKDVLSATFSPAESIVLITENKKYDIKN